MLDGYFPNGDRAVIDDVVRVEDKLLGMVGQARIFIERPYQDVRIQQKVHRPSSNMAAISSLYLSRSSGDLSFPLAMPIRLETGSPLNAVILTMGFPLRRQALWVNTAALSALPTEPPLFGAACVNRPRSGPVFHWSALYFGGLPWAL